MDEATSTLVIIGAEIGAVLLLLFVIFLVVFLRRRAEDKRYVANFIAEHKEAHAEKREGMRNKLASDSLLSDSELDELVDQVASSERKLYKRILNMYLGFDRKCLNDIREELAEMNQRWIETIEKNISLMPEGAVSEEEVEKLNKEIESLTAENSKIAAELSEAMVTMEDIVKEYSLMYAGQENETMERLSEDYQKLKDKADSHN